MTYVLKMRRNVFLREQILIGLADERWNNFCMWCSSKSHDPHFTTAFIRTATTAATVTTTTTTSTATATTTTTTSTTTTTATTTKFLLLLLLLLLVLLLPSFSLSSFSHLGKVLEFRKSEHDYQRPFILYGGFW